MLRQLLYHFQEMRFNGVFLVNSLFTIANSSKAMKTIENIALRMLNIFPLKIGVAKLDYDLFSKYKHISQMLEDDPLNSHVEATANSILQLQSLVDDLPEQHYDKMMTPPIVIIQGGEDRFKSPRQAVNFYEQIQTQDKQFWLYEHMGYAWNLEKEYKHIEKRMVYWLDSHLTADQGSK